MAEIIEKVLKENYTKSFVTSEFWFRDFMKKALALQQQEFIGIIDEWLDEYCNHEESNYQGVCPKCLEELKSKLQNQSPETKLEDRSKQEDGKQGSLDMSEISSEQTRDTNIQKGGDVCECGHHECEHYFDVLGNSVCRECDECQEFTPKHRTGSPRYSTPDGVSKKSGGMVGE